MESLRYLPDTQLVQLDDPLTVEIVPNGHATHFDELDDAVVEEYVPAAQLMHDDELELAWYFPVPQLEQTLAPAEEYVPATHAPETADSPVDEQYDPAVH